MQAFLRKIQWHHTEQVTIHEWRHRAVTRTTHILTQQCHVPPPGRFRIAEARRSRKADVKSREAMVKTDKNKRDSFYDKQVLCN